MSNNSAQDLAKVSITLNMAGVAGTIPALALILTFHHAVIYAFLSLPLPVVVYIVLWLFICGAMLSAHSFYFNKATPAYISYGLWVMGSFWLAIALGYAIVPKGKTFLYIVLPVTVIVLLTNYLAIKGHRENVNALQKQEGILADLDKLQKRLEELSAVYASSRSQDGNSNDQQR